jgi:hypothetical protein
VENLPGVEDDRNAEGDGHGAIVYRCRTPYLARQLSMFSPKCALLGSPRSAFGRTATSITTRWYVRMHVGTHGLYRFGPRECVTHYYHRTSQVIGPTCTYPCLKDLRRLCMCTKQLNRICPSVLRTPDKRLTAKIAGLSKHNSHTNTCSGNKFFITK